MFLVNSDLTLRAQLTEFKDHKLIKSKKVYLYITHQNFKNIRSSSILFRRLFFYIFSQGSDGVEYLSVALEESTLKQFLANEEDYAK